MGNRASSNTKSKMLLLIILFVFLGILIFFVCSKIPVKYAVDEGDLPSLGYEFILVREAYSTGTPWQIIGDNLSGSISRYDPKLVELQNGRIIGAEFSNGLNLRTQTYVCKVIRLEDKIIDYLFDEPIAVPHLKWLTGIRSTLLSEGECFRNSFITQSILANLII